MHDLLSADGSIYVHMGPAISHYVRAALDEVFGRDRSLREIIWKRVSSRSHGNYYPATHDYILFYSKTDTVIWNQLYEPLSDDYTKSKYRFEDADGRRYRKDNCLNQNPDRPNLTFEWNGHVRTWRWTKERMQELHDCGRLIYTKTGIPEYKRYLDESEGIALQSVWTDINPVNSQAHEDTDYPTQKPEALIERIIRASSNMGDLVADFFIGSGTTGAVAEKLGRKWIATDLGKFAIHTTRKRLIQVQREKKAAGREFRAFEVLNLGRYERQAYLHIGGRLTEQQRALAIAQKEHEFHELILRAYKATGFSGMEGAQALDGFFQGARNGRLVVIGPINLPVGRLFVEEVITECRKRGATRADILAFEFEMGLFPAVLEEARGKGIDLAPKYIPAEVFDKRAVERGQVVFHDVSFVEAVPRYNSKNKLEVRIELADFSVYYTQGAAEAAIAAMKEGKSEVICEQGQLYKVTKNKDAVIRKELLTKVWTDWVDYWAVDFDYFQRKEIIKVPIGTDLGGIASLPGFEPPQGELTVPAFEERWTGGYIFENEWQSFRTRQNPELELMTAVHTYQKPGRYTVAVKVIDIFGNDTMTLVPVNVG